MTEPSHNWDSQTALWDDPNVTWDGLRYGGDDMPQYMKAQINQMLRTKL